MRFNNPHHPGAHTASRGFTLVEVLAAMLFMAIVIPVAMEAMQISSEAGEVAAMKASAARVADRILADAAVVTNSTQAVRNGTLSESGRDYRYTLRSEIWTQDSMRLLTSEVTFDARGRQHQVRISTLVPMQ